MSFSSVSQTAVVLMASAVLSEQQIYRAREEWGRPCSSDQKLVPISLLISIKNMAVDYLFGYQEKPRSSHFSEFVSFRFCVKRTRASLIQSRN